MSLHTRSHNYMNPSYILDLTPPKNIAINSKVWNLSFTYTFQSHQSLDYSKQCKEHMTYKFWSKRNLSCFKAKFFVFLEVLHHVTRFALLSRRKSPLSTTMATTTMATTHKPSKSTMVFLLNFFISFLHLWISSFKFSIWSLR